MKVIVLLCCRHKQGNKCRFSNAPNNYCLQAHSEDELKEWKERYEWRMMKKDMAKFCHLYSYMDDLLDEYNSSLSKTSVVSIFERCSHQRVTQVNFTSPFLNIR